MFQMILYRLCCFLVTKSCLTLATPRLYPSRLLCLRDFPGKYWNGLPFPSAGDLPDPAIKPMSPALAGRVFATVTPGKPIND